MSIAWLIIAVLVGCAIGWAWAHRTVANECKYLGRFYVDGKVYHCTAITTPEKKPSTPPAG